MKKRTHLEIALVATLRSWPVKQHKCYAYKVYNIFVFNANNLSNVPRETLKYVQNADTNICLLFCSYKLMFVRFLKNIHEHYIEHTNFVNLK